MNQIMPSDILVDAFAERVVPLLKKNLEAVQRLEARLDDLERRHRGDDILSRQDIADLRHCSLRTVDRLLADIPSLKCAAYGKRRWTRKVLEENNVI